MFLDDSDTDSDDEDFQAGASDNNARDDTDSLTGKHWLDNIATYFNGLFNLVIKPNVSMV